MPSIKLELSSVPGELRRFNLDQPSFAQLSSRIAGLYPTLSSYRLTWVDSDNDRVTIASDSDLNEAFLSAKNSPLRVTITPQEQPQASSINREEESDSMNATPAVSQPEPELQPSLPQQQEQQQEEEQEEEDPLRYDDQGRVIHPHVTCDSCNRPLSGIRYKCAECEDFDLCEECEQKGAVVAHHNADHVVLKIRKPTRVEIFQSFRSRSHGRCRGRAWANHRNATSSARWQSHCAWRARAASASAETTSTASDNAAEGFTGSVSDSFVPAFSQQQPFEFGEQLRILREMGFVDDSINVQLLRARNGQLEAVVEQLTNLQLF